MVEHARLEVVNPGPLPLGVTPQNVLHTTVCRNEHLARLFHDLKRMEREGIAALRECRAPRWAD